MERFVNRQIKQIKQFADSIYWIYNAKNLAIISRIRFIFDCLDLIYAYIHARSQKSATGRGCYGDLGEEPQAI